MTSQLSLSLQDQNVTLHSSRLAWKGALEQLEQLQDRVDGKGKYELEFEKDWDPRHSSFRKMLYDTVPNDMETFEEDLEQLQENLVAKVEERYNELHGDPVASSSRIFDRAHWPELVEMVKAGGSRQRHGKRVK